MILRALAEYYQRLSNDPSVEIPPPGFERKAIDFLIVIDRDGQFVDLIDAREGVGRKRRGRPTLVPKAVKRTRGVAANLLWDTAPYALGQALPEKGKDLTKLSARAAEQHEAFTRRIREMFATTKDAGIQAVIRFLERADHADVLTHPVWKEVEENGGNLSFRLAGDARLICQRPEVVSSYVETLARTARAPQVCCVSGTKDVPAQLHTEIKGVWGTKSSRGNIVSFNLDAFRSFGKRQGYNAPVSQKVEFAYTTALNYLLASERQRMQVGDASTVFWAREPCDLENDFYALIGQPKSGEEAINYEKIRSLLSAVKTGIPPEESEMPFYVLGLAPNASRIAVRFWYEGNVKDIKERIAAHFRDLEIVKAPYDPKYLSLARLLRGTARRSSKHPFGDENDIPPHLAGDVMHAILSGTPYPRILLQKVVNRVKAEQGFSPDGNRRVPNVTFERASAIKAFFSRLARLSGTQEKEVSVALDPTYDNIGYVLGRLFAVLERIQEEAQGKNLNRTIRDTFFSAASSSPLVTFRRLQDLAVHHLAKIRNRGERVGWLERLLGEVNDLIPPTGIPATLSLDDQGRFAVGYYHQRLTLPPKKQTENKGGEA